MSHRADDTEIVTPLSETRYRNDQNSHRDTDTGYRERGKPDTSVGIQAGIRILYLCCCDCATYPVSVSVSLYQRKCIQCLTDTPRVWYIRRVKQPTRSEQPNEAKRLPHHPGIRRSVERSIRGDDERDRGLAPQGEAIGASPHPIQGKTTWLQPEQAKLKEEERVPRGREGPRGGCVVLGQRSLQNFKNSNETDHTLRVTVKQ